NATQRTRAALSRGVQQGVLNGRPSTTASDFSGFERLSTTWNTRYTRNKKLGRWNRRCSTCTGCTTDWGFGYEKRDEKRFIGNTRKTRNTWNTRNIPLRHFTGAVPTGGCPVI